RTTRRRHRRCGRGDRARRRFDPQRVSADRVPAGIGSREGAAPPRRTAQDLPRGSRIAMSAVGWGKVILLGEHAVVYGYPALAAASASESVMHGRASGIDATLATHGGIGVYRKTSGLRPLSAKLRVLVAPSGAPRSTAAMVDRVAQATISGRTKSPSSAGTTN